LSTSSEISTIVANALREDIGGGDVTSTPIIPADTQLEGVFLVKATGIVAGLDVVAEVFRQVDNTICFNPRAADGDAVQPGDIVATVSGCGPGILIAERTALNLLQRMSGIATMAHRYQAAVAGTRARILDTRKTAPGLRALDKLAVRLGGAYNHRVGLYDMVLIKDNHIEAAGSISAAVARVRSAGINLLIEVEVTNLEQLAEALSLQIDRVMLDNMSLDQMRAAVALTAGQVELEASGGITFETVAQVAATGVDFISVGALTHSVQALDVSLDIILRRPGKEAC